MVRKTAAKKPTPRKAKKAAQKVARKKPARKATPKRPSKPAFGRPGTAGKADGNAPVKAWIAAVRPEHRPIVQKLDKLIAGAVPGVRRALKWSSPMYGLPGKGWFASMASFKNYVSLVFFKGADLTPPPPFGEGKDMRRINIETIDQVDEKLFRAWIEQASSRPGWGKVE